MAIPCPAPLAPLIVTSPVTVSHPLTYCNGLVLSIILNPSPLSPPFLEKVEYHIAIPGCG